MRRLLARTKHSLWLKARKRKQCLINAMESWSRVQVRDWQWERIQSLLNYAQQNVPYYKALFQRMGVESASDIGSWEDFARIPLLTKEGIQNYQEELRSRNVSATPNQTGGSTGQVLHFLQDRNYLEYAALARLWGTSLMGFPAGAKNAYVWGSEYDSKRHTGLRGWLGSLLNNRMFINAFDISEQKIREYVFRLVRWEPEFVFGYASTLGLLADVMLKEDLRLELKGLQSTAGTLYPSLREKLNLVFGKNVYDRYGCREVSIIAHECNLHHGLHECSFHNFVELVEVGPGVAKIVVTNLHNKAFPFIRYEIGDFAVAGPSACECGREFPLLQRILGRSVEIIRSPSGKLIDGEFFTHLFYRVRGVKRFQVIQETPSILLLRIVRDDTLEESAISSLIKTIHKHGDAGFEVHVEYVSTIQPFQSGKLAFVISRVADVKTSERIDEVNLRRGAKW